MVSLIVLSVIVLILKETPPYNRNRPLNKAMNQMEVVFNIIFTTEIMLRLSIAETIWQAADLYIVFDILSLVVNKRGLRFDRGSGNTKMVKKVKEMFKALRMLRC
ncbi:voltage-gated potassium channel [Aureococcus anophagefferens]|nr:voltage-gated potassium channel [Aureococcus anophagefferens]